MNDLFRLYASDELGKDGYPPEWHNEIIVGARRFQGVKDYVRDQAGHRCVRCGHPYRKGEHGNGEWSRCDDECDHGGPFQIRMPGDFEWIPYDGGAEASTLLIVPPFEIEAQWRILTVHHLNLDKANCRWWNLASLCQRCHLTIQGRVQLHRVWPWPHSEWFKPYAAGWYAHAYLGEDLDREQTMARLDELLALELA